MRVQTIAAPATFARRSRGRSAYGRVLAVTTAVVSASILVSTTPCRAADAELNGSGCAVTPNSGSKLEQAKAKQAEGIAAFRDGQYVSAIEAFREADQCVPSAALSFNVARAYDRLGDTGQSLFWYADYLRRAPDAADANQTRALIAEREAALAARGTQLLVVRTNPDHASVRIDGGDVCTSPCASVTTPGVHTLTLTHEGRVPLEVRVDVGLARLHEVHFDLARVATVDTEVQQTSVSADETPKSASVIVAHPAATVPRRQPPALAAATGRAPNTWGWVTLAAGGVGLGVAGGLELVRRDAEADATAARVQVDKHAALERMDDAMWGARVAGALGGALLLTSGVLWWLGSGETADSSPELTARVNPSQFGVEVSLVGEMW